MIFSRGAPGEAAMQGPDSAGEPRAQSHGTGCSSEGLQEAQRTGLRGRRRACDPRGRRQGQGPPRETAGAGTPEGDGRGCDSRERRQRLCHPREDGCDRRSG